MALTTLCEGPGCVSPGTTLYNFCCQRFWLVHALPSSPQHVANALTTACYAGAPHSLLALLLATHQNGVVTSKDGDERLFARAIARIHREAEYTAAENFKRLQHLFSHTLRTKERNTEGNKDGERDRR